MQRYFIPLVRSLILIILYQVKLPTHKIKINRIPQNTNPLKISNFILKVRFESVSLTLKKLCINTLIIMGLNAPLGGQNIQLSAPRELQIGGSLLLFTGVNLYLTQHYPTPSHTWEVGGLDKLNRSSYDVGNAKLSDLGFLGTAATSFLVGIALPKQQRLNYGIIAAQNVWIAGNLVQVTKVISGRNRPYVQGTGWIPQEGKDNSYSFFSGHSAIASSMATTALVATYKNQNPSGFSWGKATALTAGALAITTGVLRIAAGKHYPSDVLVGLAVGAGVSLLNMAIHENR